MAALSRSTFWARNSATSAYGIAGDKVTARWMSQRNGTSAWQAVTRSPSSAAEASARAPPWLAPLTAILELSTPSSSAAVSTARTASTYSLVK